MFQGRGDQEQDCQEQREQGGGDVWPFHRPPFSRRRLTRSSSTGAGMVRYGMKSPSDERPARWMGGGE